MKKTIITGLLLVLTAFVLSACGGEGDETPAPTQAISPETTVEPERTIEPEATDEATDETAANGANAGQIILASNPVVQQETAEAESESDEATDEATEEADSDTAADAQTAADVCAANVPADEPATREFAEPEQVLEAGVDYRAVICTDAGAVYIDLFEDTSPITVNNFVFLAQNDYYNNTIFHRVLQDFMAQGGDPTGTGSGGPGYQFQDEFTGYMTFDRPGLLAMANANRPEQGIVGTNGSQFFITTVATPHLNFRHTIFGEVLEGQDNVLAMQLRDPSSPDVTADTPATVLQTVVIITDPQAVTTSYEPDAPASAEEVLAGFDAFGGVLPPGLTHVASQQIDDIDATVDRAPVGIQTEYRDFLTANNFEYSFDSTISNDSCDHQTYVFTTAGYQLLAFATAADASAVMQDEFLVELAEMEGYEASELTTLGHPVYVRNEVACETDVRSGLAFVQRGRFVVMLRVTMPTGNAFDVDIVLDQLVARNYELSLADVLRREVTR